MNANDITLVHVNEISSTLNLDEKLSQELKSKMKIAFLFVLQHQEGNPAFALHSVIRVLLEDKTLLEGGATLVMESKTWNNMNHDEEYVRNSDFATRLIAYALPFVNGVLYVKTKNTPMDGMFLPMINPEELRNTLRVEKVEK